MLHTPSDCNDGLYCNGMETCVDGTCQNGTSVDCSDGIGCTDDACNEANDACDNMPNNDNCDDGVFCNGVEICDASNDCLAGTPVTCLDDSLFCTGDEICDGGTDACISTGNPCQEGDICNDDQDVCEGSSCSNPNGVCDEGEDCSSCPEDCISGSGGGSCDACFKGKCDGICNPKKETSECSDCAPTVSWCCGDGVCEGDEDSDNCAIDCGRHRFAVMELATEMKTSATVQRLWRIAVQTKLAAPTVLTTIVMVLTDCGDSDCDSDPACSCGAKKSPCTEDSECCSNRCSVKGVCL